MNGVERQKYERLQDWIHTIAHYVARGYPYDWISSSPISIEHAPHRRVRFTIELDAPALFTLMKELKPERERRQGHRFIEVNATGVESAVWLHACVRQLHG